MARCTSSLNMTSGTSYYSFSKNGVTTAYSTGINTPNNSNTTLYNLTFASGDTFKIVTLNSGSYSSNTTVQIRINLIFQCVGIKGADGVSPTITVGTTSTVASGVNASVINSGTSTNQILNFSIPQGIQGPQGYVGLTPVLSIGSVVNLAQGSTPYVNFDATSTTTNKIFNFGLVKGTDAITPTFIIGSVSNLANGSTPYVIFDSASTTTNKIINFGLVQGLKGDKGDSIKGDKGDTGPSVDFGDILNFFLTGTAFLTLQGQVSTLQGQMLTLNSTTIPAIVLRIETLESTTGDTLIRVGHLETDVDGIQTKLINVVKTSDALQVKSKFQIVNTGVNPLSGAYTTVLTTFDPVLNSITLGRTGTTNSMLGDTITMGSSSTATTTILGTTITMGSSSSTTTNMLGTIINTGTTETTTSNLKGHTLNVGESGFSDTVNVQASNINIGTGTNSSINIGTTLASVDITNSNATVDITGTTIDIAQNASATVNLGTFDTNVNIEGQTVNIGYHAFGTTNVINMQGSTINIGTTGVGSTVNIGNVLSNVFIESRDNTAIGIGNFFDQLI